MYCISDEKGGMREKDGRVGFLVGSTESHVMWGKGDRGDLWGRSGK